LCAFETASEDHILPVVMDRRARRRWLQDNANMLAASTATSLFPRVAGADVPNGAILVTGANSGIGQVWGAYD